MLHELLEELFPGLREGGPDGRFADAQQLGYLAVLEAVLLAHAQDLHLCEGQLPDALLQPACVLLVLEHPRRVVFACESYLVAEAQGNRLVAAELGDAEVSADGEGEGRQRTHLVEPMPHAPEPQQHVLHVVLGLRLVAKKAAAQGHEVGSHLSGKLAELFFLHFDVALLYRRRSARFVPPEVKKLCKYTKIMYNDA